MYSGHQALHSPPLDPGGEPGARAGVFSRPQPMGMDANQLKARLYATSEVHSNTRPQFKVVRRRSKTSEVSY